MIKHSRRHFNINGQCFNFGDKYEFTREEAMLNCRCKDGAGLKLIQHTDAVSLMNS